MNYLVPYTSKYHSFSACSDFQPQNETSLPFLFV